MPPRGGGRGGSDERSIQIRRAVAGAVLLVVVILIVVGIHGCTSSATKSALESYNDSVYSLIRSSNQTGSQFFGLMSSGGGSTSATTLQSELEATRLAADRQLKTAEGLNAPSQVTQAQRYLVLTMQMRRDAIGNVARKLQPALQSSTGASSIDAIATEMARLYASDVVYKDYALPLIEGALQSQGVTVGGANGEPVDIGQFMPNLQWLSPSFVAQELKVSFQGSTTNANCSGLHGHSLNSVSVGGTTLQTGATNTITGSPAPTFSLNITNGGTFTENNVQLKVTTSPGSDSGEKTLAQTTAGETTTGQVTLSKTLAPGSYNVTAEVAPVPCEKNTSNNTLTYTVSVP